MYEQIQTSPKLNRPAPNKTYFGLYFFDRCIPNGNKTVAVITIIGYTI